MPTAAEKTVEQLADETRALIIEQIKGSEGKNQEQITAGVKLIEAKMQEWAAAADTKLVERFKGFEEKSERLIKERTARAPGMLSAPGDGLTIGKRVIETEHFKSLSATEFSGRSARMQITVPGNLREAKAITTVTSGYPIQPVRVGVFPPPTLPLVMRDLVTVVPITATNAISYILETWTYGADYQLLEGDKKAEGVSPTYVEKLAAVRTIAWWVKVSRQMMADAPYFASTVDDQLIYGVLKKEDTEILMGDNSAGHLHGIYPQATVMPAGVLVDIGNSADVLLAAIAHLAGLGYRATAIVINPIDWAQMQIMKNTQGAYILGGPPSALASPTLWGVPVAATFAMPPGKFLVGEFPPNATLYDRESVTVDIAYENEDDFVRNMVTIRAEERIALAVFRPQAFVKGDLAVPVVP